MVPSVIPRPGSPKPPVQHKRIVLVMVMAVSTQVLLVTLWYIWYQNDQHEVLRKFPDLVCDNKALPDPKRGTGGQNKHTTLINLKLSEPLRQGFLIVQACRMVSDMQNLISDIIC